MSLAEYWCAVALALLNADEWPRFTSNQIYFHSPSPATVCRYSLENIDRTKKARAAHLTRIENRLEVGRLESPVVLL